MHMREIPEEWTKRREGSLISGCEMENLFTLKNFPIHMMAQSRDEEQYCCDLDFKIGKEDGFVQLSRTIVGEKLYVDTHSNAIGGTWQKSREFMADIIKKYCNLQTDILELGGATGKLNVEVNKKNTIYKSWTIIDPQPCPDELCTAKYIQGFFPDGVKIEEKYDIVIHSHCIEHSEDISVFFNQCTKTLKQDGRMIFALPDMERLLEKNTTSILNFEHTFLLTDEYIRYLLGQEGYKICEVSRFGDGHSIVYDTKYTGIIEKCTVKDLYFKIKDVLQKYFENQKQMIEAWNKKISESHERVFLFGAHISSQYYVSYGLDLSKIEAILDNDPYKIGKYVSGIDKEVISPKALANCGEIKVIVPPSPYANEIKEGILQVNEKAVFI